MTSQRKACAVIKVFKQWGTFRAFWNCLPEDYQDEIFTLLVDTVMEEY